MFGRFITSLWSTKNGYLLCRRRMAGDERDIYVISTRVLEAVKPRVKLLQEFLVMVGDGPKLRNTKTPTTRSLNQPRDPNIWKETNANYRNCNMEKLASRLSRRHGLPCFLGSRLHSSDQHGIGDFDGRLKSSIFTQSLRHRYQFRQFRPSSTPPQAMKNSAQDRQGQKLPGQGLLLLSIH